MLDNYHSRNPKVLTLTIPGAIVIVAKVGGKFCWRGENVTSQSRHWSQKREDLLLGRHTP